MFWSQKKRNLPFMSTRILPPLKEGLVECATVCVESWVILREAYLFPEPKSCHNILQKIYVYGPNKISTRKTPSEEK